MKHYLRTFIFVLFTLTLFFSCNKEETLDAAAGSDEQNTDQEQAAELDTEQIGYAYGVLIGKDLERNFFEMDIDAFMRGLKDSKEKTDDDLKEIQFTLQMSAQIAMKKKAEEEAKKEQAFFEKNKQNKNIKTTDSGIQYEVITEGTGPQPAATDSVRVEYTGTLLDGTEFDGTKKQGKPADLIVNQTIPGWSEGIQLMKEGSRFRLYIPAKLAYGEKGVYGVIPPNSPLIFDIELVKINDPEEAAPSAVDDAE